MNDHLRRILLRVLTSALALSLAACRHSRSEPPAAQASGQKETKETAPPPGPPLRGGTQKRIEALRQIVDRDPGDTKAWIALGNEYFDSRQKENAIAAYGKALRLQPDNADVLTDQGIMYRELGAYDKAIANFERASTVNPKHLQSLLNLGVLYAQDLKDEGKAIQQWNRLIDIAPASPEAAKAREYIARLKPSQRQ